MGYYDSVKDSIRENNKENESQSNNASSGGNFDTLKEKAEETSSQEKKGDDTPIEVLEDDGLSRKSPKQKQSRSQESKNNTGNPLTSGNESDSSGNANMGGVEEKLDKLIEQNQRMIEILESFGQ